MKIYINTLAEQNIKSKSGLAYQTALACMQNPNEPQICGKNVGSGRYSSSKEWSMEAKNMLLRTGIDASKIIITNVAKNGGKHGFRITVLS